MQLHKLRVIHLRPPSINMRPERGPCHSKEARKYRQQHKHRERSGKKLTDLVMFSAAQQAPVIMLTPVQHSYNSIMLIPLQHCQGPLKLS